MRQLNNKHFDTIQGASARQGEVVSSASSPLVSQQKDENMNKHALVLSTIDVKGTSWKQIVSRLEQLVKIKEGDWMSIRGVIQILRSNNLISRTSDLKQEVYTKNCVCFDCLEVEEKMFQVKKGKYKGCFFCKECLNWRGLSSAIVKAYKKHINEGVK